MTNPTLDSRAKLRRERQARAAEELGVMIALFLAGWIVGFLCCVFS